MFKVVLIPQSLRKVILNESHNLLGHPGAVKLYMFLRKRYYWKNLKAQCTADVHNASKLT